MGMKKQFSYPLLRASRCRPDLVGRLHLECEATQYRAHGGSAVDGECEAVQAKPSSAPAQPPVSVILVSNTALRSPNCTLAL